MAAPLRVIGGGLAGPEAAYQIARRGLEVELWEMRPRVSTAAHQTGALGELVCSNSLKSETPYTAPWLLKEELRRAGSLLLPCAAEAAVPGGQALSVDRERFSAAIERGLARQPGITLRREEAVALPPERTIVLASGPLTSTPLAEALARLTGREHLYFYDAISPIVEADSVDPDKVFAASRHGKGGDDYLNCPLDREQYERFHAALLAAESYPLRAFEEPRFFEACLPLEELARRGKDTLRFGPMKPVGLPDPRTGRVPYAVVQLRQENLRADSYNLVGFQNHLRFGAQAEVLRLIPGLERARFLRFGQVHRNSYVQAPAVLDGKLRLRAQPSVFVAGQLCGTEGYVEAIATGYLAGVFAAAQAHRRTQAPPPRATALGSLLHYITQAPLERYTPANITFDLLPPLEQPERERGARHQRQCERALAALAGWLEPPGTPEEACA
ncbi:MAG TPA: methylenetetrahydrofolate--tRNA-(uracil(54)-C(5))-methyltransferase (FADH(2)-oxidizing) TrmFO [Terriglobales bacterium]|nr:methylenetetrahydrofolate--tRNA-(uracil(54)-C(5))-methyltransferase (FADH(2)-oxidizing) TrmFO [Terriglobales bacterium]